MSGGDPGAGRDGLARRGDGGEPPFPSPLQASLLALLGVFLASLVAVLLADVTSPTTAAGLATVIGVGAAGALGAANVPPPHAERLGLRGLRLLHLPPLLLLVPVALFAAALDPLLSTWLPAPDAETVAERMREVLPTDDRLALVETLVVAVGLAPIVEEWLFRGVIQQGLVARLGVPAGVVTTALLFAIGHGGGGFSAQSTAAVVAQIFVIGLTLGFARQATGSLLAPILLHAGVNAVGVLGLALGADAASAAAAAEAPQHQPPAMLAASAAAVALGVWWLRRVPPAPLRPDPPAADEGGAPR
jgi:membrane protease YdiL (CAAX protease family)